MRSGPTRSYKGDVHILVVEGEQKMARALREGLEADDYSVQVAHTGEEGFYLVQAQPFDLVILDVMLPGHDGFEILATLRRRGIKTSVLLLTSRDAIEDRVRGLDTGADDYLVKPFAFPELLARIRVLLRRGKPDVSQRLKLGGLEVDVAQRCVERGGQPIELTAREFELLEYLFATGAAWFRGRCSPVTFGKKPPDKLRSTMSLMRKWCVCAGKSTGSLSENSCILCVGSASHCAKRTNRKCGCARDICALV